MHAQTFQWQAMLRETGRPIGTPRTATIADMEARANRLPGVLWYRIGSEGYVIYAPDSHTEGRRKRPALRALWPL